MKNKNIYHFDLTIFSTLIFILLLYHQSWSQAIPARNSSADRPYTLVEVNPPKVVDDSKVYAIKNVHIIDGTNAQPIANGTVLIEGNRIVKVGTASTTPIPSKAEIFDGQGKTLMPGLLDAHLHTLNNNKTLALFLKNGVTGFRDPGHPFHFYQSMAFADHALPRAFLTGAHFDDYPAVYPDHGLMIKDPDHARQMVEHHVKKGSSAIKIYFRLPLEYYEAVIGSAEYFHIPVVAHLELVDADDGILAGLSGIEHVTSFGSAIAHPDSARVFKEKVTANSSARRVERFKLWASVDLNSNRVKQVIKLAAEHNIYFCPTLATFERRKGDGIPEYEIKAFENMMAFVGMAHRAGVKIVTGSHTTGKYVDFGWAYQREMELLVECGLSPMDAIQSSTLFNAQYFRTENRLGTIQEGKLADFILIDGNPLKNISDMYKVDGVMLNGQWLPQN